MENGPTQHTLKVILTGPSAAGKTTIMKCYMRTGDHTATPEPTIGMDFQVAQRWVHNRWFNLQLWDTAGQARFACVTDSAFTHCHAVVGVVDLHQAYVQMTNMAQKSQASNMAELMDEYLAGELERIRHGMKLVENAVPRPPLVLLGNKIDLLTHGNIEYNQVAVRNRLKHVAEQELGGVYFDVSGKTGEGVGDAFKVVLDRAAHIYETKHGLCTQPRVHRERPVAPAFPVDSDDTDWSSQRLLPLRDEMGESLLARWRRRLLCCCF